MQMLATLNTGDNIVAIINDNSFIPSISKRGNCVVLSSTINNAFIAILFDGGIDVYNADGASGADVQIVGECSYFLD